MPIHKPTSGDAAEVFVVDVLSEVTSAMQVPVVPATNPVTYLTINYEPGRNGDIVEALARLDFASLGSLKYPLIAVVMPIPERNSLGFLEVTFPRIYSLI